MPRTCVIGAGGSGVVDALNRIADARDGAPAEGSGVRAAMKAMRPADYAILLDSGGAGPPTLSSPA